MTIASFLIAHGGALILPLAVIEGPVVSIVTGFLSACGYFGWYWALGLLICGDVIGDLLYYWIGRGTGTPLAGLVRRIGPRCVPGIELQRELARNSARMLVIGKWTHAIGGLVLVGSGMLRLPLTRFLLVNTIATIPKSAVLFGIGYFAGHDLPLIERNAIWATSVLGVLGGAAILLLVRRFGAVRSRS